MVLFSPFLFFSFLAVLSLAQAQAQSQLLLTVFNNCPYTIWPAIQPNNGFPILEKGGFALTTLSYRSFSVPNTHWVGRIWGRTGCTSTGGRFSCATGDCDNRLQCNGLGGQVPATLAELNIHEGNMDHSSYDVSLVDGFNLPMTLTPHQGKGVCPVVGCKANLLDNCPEPLKLRGLNGKGPVIGCKSGCVAYNTDELCCRNAFNSPQKCRASAQSKYFKQACPDTNSYPFDTPVTVDCAAPRELKVIFCQ